MAFLVECKTSTSPCKSVSIKKEWLEKNLKEALFMGKEYNALAFNFGPNQPNYYIIDENLFKELLAYVNRLVEWFKILQYIGYIIWKHLLKY